MLAEARRVLPPEGALPGRWVADQKADGFRAILFARPGQMLIHSRRGSDLTPAFPDLAAAASALGQALVLDGELVVPHGGRLGELQRRARRWGTGAAQAAARSPAYLIVFDVLEAAGSEQLARPYRDRRAVLENLFVLGAPFTLCPNTADRATARDWLDPAWGTAGIEGVVLRGLHPTCRANGPGSGACPEHVRGGDRRCHRLVEGAAHPAAGPLQRSRRPADGRPHHPADDRSPAAMWGGG